MSCPPHSISATGRLRWPPACPRMSMRHFCRQCGMLDDVRHFVDEPGSQRICPHRPAVSERACTTKQFSCFDSPITTAMNGDEYRTTDRVEPGHTCDSGHSTIAGRNPVPIRPDRPCRAARGHARRTSIANGFGFSPKSTVARSQTTPASERTTRCDLAKTDIRNTGRA
jgi:hypothetical protein